MQNFSVLQHVVHTVTTGHQTDAYDATFRPKVNKHDCSDKERLHISEKYRM
jgi:hypothetical protein